MGIGKLLGTSLWLGLCIGLWMGLLGMRGVAMAAEAAKSAEAAKTAEPTHGLVGLRPLPRDTRDHKENHGGSWAGTPTYVDQKGQYPSVAEHLDVVKDWLEGDFKTKRVFFEYYWGIHPARDVLDPVKNGLIQKIKQWESQGGEVVHILICREYDLAIKRGHKDATPGPFKEDTRILFEKEVDDIRALFKQAHAQGILKHDNYSLIQMVQEPTFFATDPRVKPIIAKMEGVAYEAHQFNRHWPLGKHSKPEKVVKGAQWTLDLGKEYIFYFGPIIWKCKQYTPFIERDWMNAYWAAGLPKQHPKMHYYLNLFPNESGRGRPVGPESDPHSNLGFTKWMIEQVKGIPAVESPAAGSSTAPATKPTPAKADPSAK